MRIIISESQYNKLLSSAPTAIKRRITPEDLVWFEDRLKRVANDSMYYNSDFSVYSDDVVRQTMHEFVVDRKDSEIRTVNTTEYGDIYDDNHLDEVFNVYWEIIPLIEEMYETTLKSIWYRLKK